MALRANRDIAHRRIGADGANPSDSEHVVFLFGFATRDEYGRQWVDERAGFPLLFVVLFFHNYFNRSQRKRANKYFLARLDELDKLGVLGIHNESVHF